MQNQALPPSVNLPPFQFVTKFSVIRNTCVGDISTGNSALMTSSITPPGRLPTDCFLPREASMQQETIQTMYPPNCLSQSLSEKRHQRHTSSDAASRPFDHRKDTRPTGWSFLLLLTDRPVTTRGMQQLCIDSLHPEFVRQERSIAFIDQAFRRMTENTLQTFRDSLRKLR